ncbi:hypothetical protein Mp_4g10100 [Marchantia polymorpha subsp. ruderalis]|uniref:RING-CH-type domain-containing protein n=2 Tax=Marchantia polymorpha TaxID=3197 RepID=A0AAF6B8B9_MARPO|nr:hypothetical protein MARPO_0132s0053 [Marchantia polymorpha]BBN08253.1 hypothetical protein Mp_4g10100 [Marchantia polymorpha subsp. ruderalis]|eukprot:PTQ29982.1 hypothetical protein MARPO_0132s0053 [Marchantia polymorpha]
MSQGGQVEETCRICLESSPIFATSYSKLSDSFFLEDDRLISPCACSGTQAFVHFKCLRRWQRSVMATRRPGAGHGPALVCSVCTQKFSVAPPRPPLGCQLWKAFAGYSCEVTGLLIILCAFYVALAGHSLQSLLDELEGGLALAREVLPCSFRLNSMEDDCAAGNCNSSLLGSKGWASSSNSNRLHPVTLLIATSSMPSPYFFGSVEDVVREWEKNALLGQNRPAMKQVEHGIGGPHAQDQWTVLHRCQECAKWAGRSGSEEKLVLSRELGHELVPGLYLGREISPLLRILDACNLSENSVSVRDCAQDVEKGGSKNENGIGVSDLSAAEEAASKELYLGFDHHVLHGHAKWVVGQLGSEIRRGWWIVDENSSDVLISTPLNELWHALRTA